jgi:hypothetical protein
MPEILGPQILLDKALPVGVDGTRIAEWALRDGVTYGELINQVAVAVGDKNEELARKWGWLFSLTEENFMEYEDGGAVTAAPDITDLDRPDPTKGSTLGHMIDLRVYGIGIGGTRRYFRDARRAKVVASIRAALRKLEWRFEQKLLTRAFTNTEKAIGSAGYDVPFVRGTGGNVDYSPPAWDGDAFDSSHDHFLGFNSSTGGVTHATMLNGLAETLQEHGHDAPYDAIVSRADITSYAALTKFVELVDIANLVLIDRGGETSGNQLFAQGRWEMGHFGDFQSDYGLIRLKATARLATGYAGLYKSYGSLAADNSLAARVHPENGFGMYLVPETTNNDQYPIKQLDVEMEYGIGVGMDRTNGAVGYLVAGGAWANPTVS